MWPTDECPMSDSGVAKGFLSYIYFLSPDNTISELTIF